MTENLDQSLSDFVEVQISDDNMKVEIVVNEPGSESVAGISTQDISSIIGEAGVKSSPNYDLIGEILEKERWGERFVACEGQYPIHGVDAQLEFHFPTEKSLKPKTKQDGHVDYREVSVVHSVEKDAILVRKTPAQSGAAGMDVFGAEVKPEAGKDLDILPGPGTYKDPENDLLIKAAMDGVVFYNPRNHNLEVQELYLIPASVDYSTGNIHVNSSVEIRGNVRPGFSVETPYNIEIKGVVEHATILCDGTLKVDAGITGDGEHQIRIGGDVHAGYIYDQSVESGGSVYVSRELRAARIESADEVAVLGDHGVIFGGKITATNKVSAAFIGNENNIQTVIEVGMNSMVKGELAAKKTEKMRLEEQVDQIRKRAKMLVEHSKKGAKNMRLAALQDEWKEVNKQCETLKKEVELLESAYYDSNNPVVQVTKTVFPGTVVKIKHTTYRVKEEISNVEFKLAGDEVVLVHEHSP